MNATQARSGANAAPSSFATDPARLLAAQRAAITREGHPELAERLERLRRLERVLLQRRADLVHAIDADYGGRSPAETLFVEVFGLVDEIRHARRHLRRWMRPKQVAGNPQTRPGRASIRYQPLGIVGVMGACNYPIYLSLSPAIGAIAAGNRVMIKPSELTPRSGALVADLLAEVFTAEQVAVVTGDIEVSRAFAALRFDHLLFTGSGRIGRQVLQQAAEQLVPVTLELGGKTPAIVAPGFDLREAADSIMHAKLLNSGQTCIAPDTAWVPQAQVAAFMNAAAEAAARYLPRLVDNPHYTRLITQQAHARLQGWLDEARARGAEVRTINPGAEDCGAGNRVLPPTLVANCPVDTALMQEEIFGPVLPVRGYESIDEAVREINAGPHPLAAYLFDLDGSRSERLVDALACGGVTVNGCLYHVGQHNLPFGGVGDSGMGAYHGFHGFERFSCRKAVFRASRLLPEQVMRPPYGRVMEWLLGWLLHGRLRRESLVSHREKTS